MQSEAKIGYGKETEQKTVASGKSLYSKPQNFNEISMPSGFFPVDEIAANVGRLISPLDAIHDQCASASILRAKASKPSSLIG